MKKTFSLLVAINFIFCYADGQITQGNWLIGGSGSLNSARYNINVGTSIQTNIQLSGDVGYFVFDKLVFGLKPGYSSILVNSPVSKVISYDFGPFTRYYFLDREKTVNVFSELAYQYGITKSNSNSDNRNRYSGNIGCVIFFNTAVALEFSVGYSYLLYNNNSGNVKYITSGIGFHFHLIE